MLERIWRWLGVCTTADLAAMRETGHLQKLIESQALLMDGRLIHMRKRIDMLEKALEARSSAAGEKKTVSDTTPTCENTASDPFEIPDHLRRH